MKVPVDVRPVFPRADLPKGQQLMRPDSPSTLALTLSLRAIGAIKGRSAGNLEGQGQNVYVVATRK
ncbi:hypothetical protein DPMN_180178 [Dreissena polymorpha]|uniref:Uncharacterized protein n=1 Tax=Dreissena polymorpha TaxID=45954 RepID=A0A9D4EG75_DREPO|nr:hypothetical protein DPMN_180178 [Dreissena polymorpha]